MTTLKGIRCRCPRCHVTGPISVIDGQTFDPPGWVKRGSDTICAECSKTLDDALHPEVQTAAERVVHSIQALMATELCAQPPPGSALAFGSNGMARRMKRCELLARYADIVMTVYGNVVGFRLASAGAFGQTTLGAVANACEDLMKAEIAFSQARANKRTTKTSGLRDGSFATVYDNESLIAGPLYRLGEISKVAQKLAQLAATRAGEVGVTQEDGLLDRAVDDAAAFNGDGLYNGRGRADFGANNDAAAMQRQILMVAQRFLEKNEERAERLEAAATPAPVSSLLADPLYELERLLETKDRLAAAGRTDAVKAVDARILLAEAKLRMSTEETAVEGALAAEAGSKDVTPKPFDGVLDMPPDDEEIAVLRRTIGDDAVRAGFPEAFARAQR